MMGAPQLVEILLSQNLVKKQASVQEIYSPPQPAANNGPQQSYFELLECHVEPNAQLEMVTLQAIDEKSSINFSKTEKHSLRGTERCPGTSVYLALNFHDTILIA